MGMSISKVSLYNTNPSKYFELKKLDELNELLKKSEAEKRFQDSIKRAQEYQEAIKDPQHLINLLV